MQLVGKTVAHKVEIANHALEPKTKRKSAISNENLTLHLSFLMDV